MSYKNFKDIDDVCSKFNLDFSKKDFINQLGFSINDYLLENLTRDYDRLRTFSSETSICEILLYPIISSIAEENNLPLWSHARFDIDKTLDLNGEPDYLLGLGSITGMKPKAPIVCLGEAKKDDFTGGWGQVAAEMYAAQLANIKKIKEDKEKNNQIFNDIILEQIKNTTIYGLVSNGTDWEFGKLENNLFTINKDSFKAPRELQKVFDTLNWIFCEARKNADQLLMIN